ELTISVSHHRRWRLRYESLIKPLPFALSITTEATNRPHPPRRTHHADPLHHHPLPSRPTRTRFEALPACDPSNRPPRGTPFRSSCPFAGGARAALSRTTVQFDRSFGNSSVLDERVGGAVVELQYFIEFAARGGIDGMKCPVFQCGSLSCCRLNNNVEVTVQEVRFEVLIGGVGDGERAFGGTFDYDLRDAAEFVLRVHVSGGWAVGLTAAGNIFGMARSLAVQEGRVDIGELLSERRPAALLIFSPADRSAQALFTRVTRSGSRLRFRCTVGEESPMPPSGAQVYELPRRTYPSPVNYGADGHI
ncbi:MAG: hypothetical protein KDD44_02095, partial [Bdellovibrionales bacterium]|nr:hypothetical protein [Bdellovibrionales bacterium]